MNDKRRRLFVIGIVFLIVLGAALGLLVADNRAKRSATVRAETVLYDSAREQAATLSAVLDGRIQVLKSISAELATSDTSDRNAINAFFADIMENADLSFSALELADAGGMILSGNADGSAQIADRAYFQRAVAGNTALASVVGRTSGKPCVILAVPYWRDGRVDGVLSGIYYEEELRALLTSEAYGGTGYSLIVDSNGNLIINTESIPSKLDGENLFDFLNRASFSAGDSVSALQASLAEGQYATIHYAYDGTARVAALVPLGDDILPENDWFVLNAVYESELLGEVTATRRDSIESMSIVTFFILLALFLFALLEIDYRKKIQRDDEILRQREEQFRVMAKQSGHSVFRYDIAAGASYRSSDVVDKFGGDDNCENVVETCIATGVVLPESVEDYRAFYRQIADGVSPVTGDFLMREENGACRWYRHVSTTLFDKKRRPQTAIISYYDCTEQRERELAYAKWQLELEKASYENAALYEWNLTRDLCDGKRGSLAQTLSALPTDALDAWASAFADGYVYGDDRPAYLALMNRERLIGRYYDKLYDGKLDYRYIENDGTLLWRRVSVQMVPYPDTQDIKLYATDQDVDREKREALALIARSEQDSLTGSLNRETFIRRVDALIKQSPAASHAMLMLDVDGFKRINDLLGHTVGDEVLIDFTQHIHSVLRANDLVGRLGGDEFMVCLPDMPFDAAIEKKAQQLCAALRRQLTEQMMISVSIGIAVYPRDGLQFSALYRAADAALYHAKAHGKDNYAFYRADMADDAGLPAESAAASVPAPALPTVLIVSDSEETGRELSSILSPGYGTMQVSGIASLTKLLDGGGSFYSVIVDADSAFGRNALHSLGMRLRAYGMGLFALSGDSSSETLKRLIDGDVTTVIPKPVDPELLLLCLDRLRQYKDLEQTKLQSEYHRLQTAEDLRYREVLQATGTTVFVYDIATRTYQADLLNRRYTAGNFDGRPLATVLVEDGIAEQADVDALMALVRRIASGELAHDSVRIRCKLRTGERHWFEIQAQRMVNADTLTPKLLIISNDINEQVESAEALRFRAERDALTGLYNRETFFEKAAEMIRSHDSGYYVLACFDIDNFKIINDQHGTEAGDKVLKHIANLFSEGFGAVGGICCRVMADHFGVLYPVSFMQTDTIAALRKAARTPGDGLPPIAFSIGRYIVTDRALSVSAMFDRAAIAEASIKGRYDMPIAEYDESMRVHLLREQEISDEMNDALQGRQFEIWLQPQYNHVTGALVGAEALARWRHPKRGVVPPGAFIPVFEHNGFIYELDKYVWEQACILLRKWLDGNDTPLPVSVNVSRYDIFREDFYDTITGLVERYALPVALLRLEITESAFAESSEQIIAMVKRLLAYGFTVEIDDFGSGYSSLNTLKDVPANVLKLDMRFLESTENSERGGNIVESVVRMAKWLGMPVIAEGVETKAQADYLASIGCYYVQGYLYSKPIPVKSFEALAARCGKEPALGKLTTVATLDNNAFWDPASMDTLIFNSYVGGACIFEYHNGKTELLRVNEKYAQALGEGMTVEDAMRLDLASCMDEENLAVVFDNIQRAIKTGAESTCEACMTGLPGGQKHTYLRVTVRVIARTDNQMLFYASVFNVTKQHEAEQRILESAEQLRFLNDMARELLEQEDIDRGIENVLQKTLDYFDGSRAFIYEYDYEESLCSNTYEVCAPGVPSYRHAYQRFPLDTAWYWLKAFRTSNFLYIKDAESLGERRRAERDVLNTLGVRSSLAVSLRVRDTVIGTMGVFDPARHLSDFDNLGAIGDYMAVILTRRNLDAKIRRDNEMLTELMNDTPGGFSQMLVRPDGSVSMRYCNDGFTKLLDMPREAIMGRYGVDAMWGVHPDDAPVLQSILAEMQEGNETRTIQYRLLRGNGEYIPLSVNLHITKNEAGESLLNAYYAVKSESDRQEAQYRQLLDNLPCAAGIYEVFPDYVNVLYLNKQYAALVGRRVDAAGKPSALATLAPGDKERLYEALTRAHKENDDLLRCDIRILHGDGGYHPTRATGKIVQREKDRSLLYMLFDPIPYSEMQLS